MRAGAQGATVILRLCAVRQVGSTLVSVLERYAKKRHHNSTQLVLTKMNERVFGQLTKTETIQLIGVDRGDPAKAEGVLQPLLLFRRRNKQGPAPKGQRPPNISSEYGESTRGMRVAPADKKASTLSIKRSASVAVYP